MDIIQNIKKRRSIRTFQNRKIDQQILTEIKDLIDSSPASPFENSFNFQVAQNKGEQNSQKLGTYGIVKNGNYFIVGSCQSPDNSELLDYGFLMERIVLFLTNLGLGSCWLGGSFSKSDFTEAVDISNNEIIPAVVVFGYPKDNRSLRDKFLVFTAGSKSRKPWKKLFFQDTDNKPLSKIEAGKFEQPLEMLRLAPSASNRQPWRVIKRNNYFHFFISKNIFYSNFLQGVNLQSIDIGIALYHFQSTVNQLNLDGKWTYVDTNFENNYEYILSWEIG